MQRSLLLLLAHLAPAAVSSNFQIRALPDMVLGVEVLGLDLKVANSSALDEVVAAMHGEGRGLIVVRDQVLSPEGLEMALTRLGNARDGFGEPAVYTPWPGQSPKLRCCSRIALLGNYRAARADELGTGAAAGERIAEYKPAVEELREWHSDGSLLPEPQRGIALYAPALKPVVSCAPCRPPTSAHGRLWRRLRAALRMPCMRCQPAPAGAGLLPSEGGETAFASTTLAYEALTAEERAELETLGAVHSWCDFMRFLEARDPSRVKVTAAQCAAKPNVAWPLVRTHPVTGRRSLYVNPKDGLRMVRWPLASAAAAVSGADDVDGGTERVLNLTRRVLATGVYRHRWRPGDLVLWDNRVLLHAATPFDAEKHTRLIYRAGFSGEPVYL